MICLVSGATKYQRDAAIGHLIVPRAWNRPETLDLSSPWAMDNGAFSGFDPGAFVRMLEQFYPWRDGCLFVTAPDVVGDAASTLALWPFWSRLIRGLGFQAAWVAQDGVRPELVPTFDALFVGGSTAFKEGAQARGLCAYAKARGLWVHWGRVNGKRRLALAQLAGADSIDGTGFSMFPDTNIPKIAKWQAEIARQPLLFQP